jgi:hypothetical protein
VHDNVRQVGTLHLDKRIRGKRGEPGARDDTVVNTLAVATGAAGALVEVRLADPGRDERREMLGRVVALLLDAYRVDDVDDVGDRDRGLGDVGREDDAPLAGDLRLKDGLLVGDGDR